MQNEKNTEVYALCEPGVIDIRCGGKDLMSVRFTWGYIDG